MVKGSGLYDFHNIAKSRIIHFLLNLRKDVCHVFGIKDDWETALNRVLEVLHVVWKIATESLVRVTHVQEHVMPNDRFLAAKEDIDDLPKSK